MRRIVQFQLDREGAQGVEMVDVDAALDEMLFRGGLLNLKILGGAERGVEES